MTDQPLAPPIGPTPRQLAELAAQVPLSVRTAIDAFRRMVEENHAAADRLVRNVHPLPDMAALARFNTAIEWMLYRQIVEVITKGPQTPT